MKQYIFSRYVRTLKEHRIITDERFYPVYSVQTPFFSSKQHIYKADQQLVATIDHQVSMEGRATIIDQHFQMDQLTKNCLVNKQIFVQSIGWRGDLAIIKAGKTIAMTRNQGTYCHIELYDEDYETDILTIAIAQDYRQIQRWVIIPLLCLFLWFIF